MQHTPPHIPSNTAAGRDGSEEQLTFSSSAVRLPQAILKRPRHTRWLWRAASYAEEAAGVVKQLGLDGAHAAFAHKWLRVVIGQKAQVFSRQDERGDGLLVVAGGAARQAFVLSDQRTHKYQNTLIFY